MKELLLGIQVTPDITQGLGLDIGSVAVRQRKAPLKATLLAGIALLFAGCAPHIDHSRGGLIFYLDTPEGRAAATADSERAQSELAQKQEEQKAVANEVRGFIGRRLKPEISSLFTPGNSKFSTDLDVSLRDVNYPYSLFFDGKFPSGARYFKLWEVTGNTLAGESGRGISFNGVTVYNREGKEISFQARVDLKKTFNQGVVPEADWLIDTTTRPARVAGEDLQSFAKTVVKIPEDAVWRTQWQPVQGTRSANGGYKEYERSENTTFVSADETTVTVTVTATTKGEVVLTEQRP